LGRLLSLRPTFFYTRLPTTVGNRDWAVSTPRRPNPHLTRRCPSHCVPLPCGTCLTSSSRPRPCFVDPADQDRLPRRIVGAVSWAIPSSWWPEPSARALPQAWLTCGTTLPVLPSPLRPIAQNRIGARRANRTRNRNPARGGTIVAWEVRPLRPGRLLTSA
jgi:hypothetical protein